MLQRQADDQHAQGAGADEPDADHEMTLDWLEAHPEVLNGLDGQWVVVASCAIVAHSLSIIEVVRIANERGVDHPLLIPVMTSEFIGH